MNKSATCMYAIPCISISNESDRNPCVIVNPDCVGFQNFLANTQDASNLIKAFKVHLKRRNIDIKSRVIYPHAPIHLWAICCNYGVSFFSFCNIVSISPISGCCPLAAYDILCYTENPGQLLVIDLQI